MLEFCFLRSQDNVVADFLSRGFDIHDWCLADHAWKKITEVWGTPTIDRFANPRNSKTARFNSMIQCQEAEGWDAFAQNWANDFNYVCPPFGLMERIVQHIVEQKSKCIVIMPVWEHQIWFPKLIPIIKEYIVLSRNDFIQGNSLFVEPWKNVAWTFWAALVIG